MSVRRPTPSRATPPGKVAPSRRLQEVLRAGVAVGAHTVLAPAPSPPRPAPVGADADPMDVDDNGYDDGPAATDMLYELVEQLRDGTDAQKEEAARELYKLADDDDAGKLAIVNIGSVPLLVALMRDGTKEQQETAADALWSLTFVSAGVAAMMALDVIPMLVAWAKKGGKWKKEKAAFLLWGLAAQSRETDTVIQREGGIPALVALVRDGTQWQKTWAMYALRSLATSQYTNRNRQFIADAGGIPLLVALARDGTKKQKMEAKEALWGILTGDHATGKTIVAAGDIPILVAAVSYGTEEQKRAAAVELSKLAGNNPGNRKAIANAGGIAPLVVLVRDGTEEQKRAASGTLLAVARNNNANSDAIVDEGGIAPLVALVRDGTASVKNNAVGALWILTEHNYVTRAKIMAAGGIPPLVASVRDGTERVKQIAALALQNLANSTEGKDGIVDAGGIPPLVALVSDGTELGKAWAAGALWNIANSTDTPYSEYIATAGGIPPLVALVRDGTEEQKLKAAGALWMLAMNYVANREAIADAGGILPLVALLRDGTVEQKKRARSALQNIHNSHIKTRLRVDAALHKFEMPHMWSCDYWIDILPKFAEVRDAMQGHGEIYDFLVNGMPKFQSRCNKEGRSSPKTLARMLLNFKILGAAATAQSNPSVLAAKTLFKVLAIEIDEAMTSRVWVNSRELLSKTLTLLKFAVPIVAAGTVVGGAAAALIVDPGFTSGTLAGTAGRGVYEYFKQKWAELKPEPLDTPEFRAMEDTRDEYNDEALDADLKALGLDAFQLQQAQRFERWLAIAGSVAAKFNAAADGGDADAKEVMELAEAFVMRLTAPPGTARAPELLFEIEARQYAAAKRSYAEMLAEEQAIEEEEAKEAQEAKEDAAKVVNRVFSGLSDAAKADAQGKRPGEAEAERDGTEPPAKRRRRRTATEISASLADVLGHEKVARLWLRAEDLHPLLVARYGH